MRAGASMQAIGWMMLQPGSAHEERRRRRANCHLDIRPSPKRPPRSRCYADALGPACPQATGTGATRMEIIHPREPDHRLRARPAAAARRGIPRHIGHSRAAGRAAAVRGAVRDPLQLLQQRAQRDPDRGRRRSRAGQLRRQHAALPDPAPGGASTRKPARSGRSRCPCRRPRPRIAGARSRLEKTPSVTPIDVARPRRARGRFVEPGALRLHVQQRRRRLRRKVSTACSSVLRATGPRPSSSRTGAASGCPKPTVPTTATRSASSAGCYPDLAPAADRAGRPRRRLVGLAAGRGVVRQPGAIHDKTSALGKIAELMVP